MNFFVEVGFQYQNEVGIAWLLVWNSVCPVLCLWTCDGIHNLYMLLEFALYVQIIGMTLLNVGKLQTFVIGYRYCCWYASWDSVCMCISPSLETRVSVFVCISGITRGNSVVSSLNFTLIENCIDEWKWAMISSVVIGEVNPELKFIPMFWHVQRENSVNSSS